VWRYWAPPLIWALVVMSLSGDLGAAPNSFSLFNWALSWIITLPPETLSQLHFQIRKALHFICYGILAVLWLRALMASHPYRLRANIILALIFCLMVALIDEGHQLLLNSRTGSVWDVILDMTGAVAFTLLAFGYWKRKLAVPLTTQPPFS
jgi:VanZ family protein